MVEVGDVINTNLVGSDTIIGIAGGFFTAIMFGVMIGIIGVGVWFLMRYFNYNIEVELWEVKGEKLEYFGNDKARRKYEQGAAYLVFLSNRDERFKSVKFPASEYLYKKKLFGTKLKYIVKGDDIFPTRLTVNPEEMEALVAESMPSYQRVDYIQKLEKIDKDYHQGNKHKTLLTIAAVGGGAMIILVGLFVIWQSNVSTAEANRALAAATQELAKSLYGGGTPQAAP